MPTVHFLRSAWTQKRSWLYSLGSREEGASPLPLHSSPLFTLPPPRLPGPQPHCGLHRTLTCDESRHVEEEEEESKAGSLSK